MHPGAIAIATQHGLDLTDAEPRRYDDLDVEPDLVVSVCDRAHESALDFDAPMLHWSVPDPADGGPDDFILAFALLSERIDRLARAVPAA